VAGASTEDRKARQRRATGWQARGRTTTHRPGHDAGYSIRQELGAVLPLSDGLPARRFPVVNVALIAANIVVWLLYELPDLGGAVAHASFYPCDVENTCAAPLPWEVSWITAMFMHGSWDHLLGNLLFLAIFGKNVEDAFGHLRYLGFYLAGGFAATALQTAMTLGFASDADAQVPLLGASGAISAVLGAFLVLYPHARIRTLVLVFFVQIPAWAYLGGWFLYQLHSAHESLFVASADGGGVAFFAHVGGFVFGWVVARTLRDAGWIDPQPAQRRRLALVPR
jgi:membrane associated rhomboid family serine protease